MRAFYSAARPSGASAACGGVPPPARRRRRPCNPFAPEQAHTGLCPFCPPVLLRWRPSHPWSHPALQALALSWQKSSGLPAFTLNITAYSNACLGCSPRENAVSFSPDGSVGLMTLPLQSPPAVYRTLDGGR